MKTSSRTSGDQAARAAEQQRKQEAARRREAAARQAEARRLAEAKQKKEEAQRAAGRRGDTMDQSQDNSSARDGSRSNGRSLFTAAAKRISDGARLVAAAARNPDRALDVAFKTPMMTERLTNPGDAQSFEVDAEVKGVVPVGTVGTAGFKGKLGGNLTIERRDDGDFDVSLKHTATLTKVGDRKKTPNPVVESKLGWEGGARVSVTETYTTSPATVEDRAADLVRDRIGDYHAVAGGALGEITNDMLDPSQADKDALAADWSKTKVEGGGFFRGQLSAKYGKMLGVETTIRDDWVQSGAVEVNRDGDVSLTLKLDNDISLKNGVFAKKGIEGKVQELSDVEGSETTLTLTWEGAARGQNPLDVAQDVLTGDWSGPDSVRLRNRVQEHDFVEQGGGKFTFDGTHAPYTETTTEVTFDTTGANRHQLAALFKGDRAQANQFNPVATQTVERFSYEGPDIDLKPEIKVPKAIKGVVDLSVAMEVETGIKKQDAKIERGMNPAAAVDQIRSNTLAPLGDPLPTTLGGPNSTPPLAEVAKTKPLLGNGSGGQPVVDAQTILQDAGYYQGEIDGQFGSQTEAAVRQFQADHQLDQDGIVGEQTWTQLLRTKHGDEPPRTEASPVADADPSSAPTNDAGPVATAPPTPTDEGVPGADGAGQEGTQPSTDPQGRRPSAEDIARVIVGAPIVAAREAMELAGKGLDAAGEALDATGEALDTAGQGLIGQTLETFAGDKWDRLSDAERAYVTDNPRLAYVFNHAADRADAVAIERGFEENDTEKGIYGDAGGNAYRHALWNALMVREAFKQDVRVGVPRSEKLADATREAKAMADAHEDNPRNTNTTNMEMDFRNNDVGRQVAAEVLEANRWASEADIATAIEQALIDGRLTSASGGSLTTATDPR